ncbi:putative Bracovirus particle protein MdBV-1-3a [Microplitis demolitor]
MILVIDFNGYLNSKNEFTIKEYSFYTMDIRGDVYTNKFEVISPDVEDLDDLDSESEKNYEIYYQKYGIEWNTGTITKVEADTDISYHIPKSRKIFLADEEKKNQLINYINVRKTPKTNYVSLKDLGYKMNFSNSTNCHYHQSPSSNNCANDNVLDMVTFVKDKKLYDTNTCANLYSIIDFNCYKYSNHSIIKEVSISRISIDGVVTSRDLFVEKPINESHSGPGNYKEYYQRYGIRWKAGNKFSRLITQNLLQTVKDSMRTYVKSNTQKNILLNLSTKDIGNKIICLDELGYDADNTELGFTACNWHDNKMANNCASDNVRLMTDWLYRKKLLPLQVRSSLKPNILRSSQAHKSRKISSVNKAVTASTSVVHKRKMDYSLMPSASRYYDAFGSMLSSTDENKRRKIENRGDNTRMINESHGTVAPNMPQFSQAYGSRAMSSVGKGAATFTSTADKRKFDNYVVPSVSRNYEAFSYTKSSIDQRKTHREIEDDDDDVFKMAANLGIKIKDNDDNVFDMASKPGIEIKDDNARVINETVAPNVPRYYQAHGPSNFPINQTEEQTNYDDENAIDIALELESQIAKHTPKNLADLNSESLYKYPIDDLYDYSFESNEFDGLLNDENDNHQSKVDVNQLNDQIGEQLLSSSISNDPNNLFDDDDNNDFNDIMNIDASLHSEAMFHNRREDNDDQKNEIFDEKFLDTYIVNNPNNISFDEDEFNDILEEDEL